MTALFIPCTAFASTESGGHGNDYVQTLAILAMIVLVAKVAGAIAERFKQVSVLGELLLGVLLSVPALFGVHFLSEFAQSNLVRFVSEIAIVLLLFQVGLESNLHEMKRVGLHATLVAAIGVAAPFVLGTYVIAPWLFPEASSHFALFLGAALTATSVGITARVFKDLGVAQSQNAKVVLGAAVIDDVIGLIILAIVNGIIQSGAAHGSDILVISAKAVGFLAVSIVVGRYTAGPISQMLSRITTNVGMKMAMALAFCFIYAFVGSVFGLAPIVGAFAAGLLLDHVHFHRFAAPKYANAIQDILKETKEVETADRLSKTIEGFRQQHVEDLVEDFNRWFIPVFFVVTGLSVNLAVFSNNRVVFSAIALTVAAILGKVVSGFAAGKGTDWKVVGFGMVPRGEVGLIFAAIGRQLNVLSEEAYAVIVIMVILTTLLTPMLLPRFMQRSRTVSVA
ncbi:cation:proton antiporter [candidate division WWE3 bacterium]|uniref:Cation:proton antiporter n=1 Tax=candidate division WWE3 bacterium TaxID=2053526 RepID=A0A928Y680_UNCKA|nr:cation:proton antiporter [candidate division WWE3 bacterium]